MAKQCMENTKRGTRCKAAPLKGMSVCLFHKNMHQKSTKFQGVRKRRK